MEEEVQKKMMFVMQRPPHGTIYPYEGLEFILIAAAYEQDISLVFLGDGVYNLMKDQETSGLGIKGFVKTYRSLEGYDVEKIYVDELSLTERGLQTDDLAVDVEVKSAGELAKMMKEQDAVFPF